MSTAVRARLGRDFRLLWTGEAVSLLGNATSTVLLPLIAVVGFGAGPVWVGALTACAWLPWLLVGLPAGAWVDVRPVRGVMIASDLVAAALVASVPVAAWLGLLSLPQLLVVAFGTGTCGVFFRAAYPTLVRQVAPEAEQERAFSRLYGTESAMQVAGPGIGGAMAQAGSAAYGLALDALSYVVSAVCLARLRVSRERPLVSRDTSLGQRVREGIAYLRGDRLLMFFTVAGGASNFGLTGIQTLMVLFLVRDLHLQPGGVGLVLALGSVGGLTGAVLAPRISHWLGSARGLLALQLVGGPGALLMLLAHPGPAVAWFVVSVAVVCAAAVAGNVIRGAWRNRYVPEHLVARQVTAAQVINFGTMPVAALASGWLGDLVGLRPTLAVMAVVHLVACLALLRSPIRGLREMPVPAAATPSATLAA